MIGMSGFSISIDPAHFLALITLVLLAVYIIFSVIFHYHWNTYATNGIVKSRTLFWYFAITIPLFLIMGLTLLFV